MTWKLGAMVAFGGRAYWIVAIMKDAEMGKINYTLNNVDRRYEFLTVTRKF
jgi:hypothetical protein